MRARANTDTPVVTRLALALAACAVLAFGPAACGGEDTSASDGAGDGAASTESAPASGATTIEINAFQFEPKTLTVDAGTEVTVVNNDEILHTWTSGTRENPSSGAPDDTPDGMFDVKLDGRGSDAAFTFGEPGTYTYFCAVHPGTGMTGEVVVE